MLLENINRTHLYLKANYSSDTINLLSKTIDLLDKSFKISKYIKKHNIILNNIYQLDLTAESRHLYTDINNLCNIINSIKVFLHIPAQSASGFDKSSISYSYSIVGYESGYIVGDYKHFKQSYKIFQKIHVLFLKYLASKGCNIKFGEGDVDSTQHKFYNIIENRECKVEYIEYMRTR